MIGGQDHRAVPLEVLRDYARTRCESTSIRAASDESGVSHSALHKFIAHGTHPQPRIRRLLALWYLEKRDEPPDVDLVRPYLAALTVLTGELPDVDQEAARALLVDDLCALHGEPLPRWLQRLRGRR